MTFLQRCEQYTIATEYYVQDMNKILRNVQYLILGLTDLTLNVLFPQTGCASYLKQCTE